MFFLIIVDNNKKQLFCHFFVQQTNLICYSSINHHKSEKMPSFHLIFICIQDLRTLNKWIPQHALSFTSLILVSVVFGRPWLLSWLVYSVNVKCDNLHPCSKSLSLSVFVRAEIIQCQKIKYIHSPNLCAIHISLVPWKRAKLCWSTTHCTVCLCIVQQH